MVVGLRLGTGASRRRGLLDSRPLLNAVKASFDSSRSRQYVHPVLALPASLRCLVPSPVAACLDSRPLPTAASRPGLQLGHHGSYRSTIQAAPDPCGSAASELDASWTPGAGGRAGLTAE